MQTVKRQSCKGLRGGWGEPKAARGLHRGQGTLYQSRY